MGIAGADESHDDEPLPASCRIEAWKPDGVPEISEVFHARIVDYGYPMHCHDTCTVLIVDTGAIAYDLDTRACGAVGDTVAILPPGVTHNGEPASGAPGFVKRVLYLEQSVLPVDLIGAAVDQTNITDPILRTALSGLHEELQAGTDPFAASSALSLITERITNHLRPAEPAPVPHDRTVAERLRLLLDEERAEPLTLDDVATQLGRSKPHLIRSFTAAYGVAPHAYLIGKRVERARKLLLDGTKPADVATEVGFYDQAHFSRHFKRHTSVPPGAFAASRRN